MPVSQRIVQVCLFLVAAIALTGGTLQMILGERDTLQRIDTVQVSRVRLPSGATANS